MNPRKNFGNTSISHNIPMEMYKKLFYNQEKTMGQIMNAQYERLFGLSENDQEEFYQQIADYKRIRKSRTVNSYVSAVTHDKLYYLAQEQGVSMSELFRQFLIFSEKKGWL